MDKIEQLARTCKEETDSNADAPHLQHNLEDDVVDVDAFGAA